MTLEVTSQPRNLEEGAGAVRRRMTNGQIIRAMSPEELQRIEDILVSRQQPSANAELAGGLDVSVIGESVLAAESVDRRTFRLSANLENDAELRGMTADEQQEELRTRARMDIANRFLTTIARLHGNDGSYSPDNETLVALTDVLTAAGRNVAGEVNAEQTNEARKYREYYDAERLARVEDSRAAEMAELGTRTAAARFLASLEYGSPEYRSFRSAFETDPIVGHIFKDYDKARELADARAAQERQQLEFARETARHLAVSIESTQPETKVLETPTANEVQEIYDRPGGVDSPPLGLRMRNSLKKGWNALFRTDTDATLDQVRQRHQLDPLASVGSQNT